MGPTAHRPRIARLCTDAWANKQRQQRSQFTELQVTLLNEIGFDWETHEMKNDGIWEEALDLLRQFKQEHGHTQVKQHEIYHGANLGVWSSSQRTEYKNGKLRRDRKEKLENIGFEWIVDERLLWKEYRDSRM